MATVRIIVIMAVSLICSPVLSADKDGQYLVSATHEVVSCRGLNSALAKAKSADSWTTLYAYSLYTMGYISGINRLAHDTYDIAGHKNAKTLLVWLERYCAENPADSFDQALFRLTLELFPNRTIAKPE